MSTGKPPLDQLFKDGKAFKFKQVDYSSPKITRELKDLEKKREEIRESAKVDINELRKMTFDI